MSRARLRALLLNDLLASRLIGPRLRARLLRLFGMDVGRAHVNARATISGRDIAIGDGTYVGYGAFLDGDGPIRIGRNCDLAQRVSIHTVSHAIGSARRRAGRHRVAGVTVGDGTWIGAGATLLPGVTVGSGCVIGAGALVSADCAPNGLYLGVPAQRVRDLS